MKLKPCKRVIVQKFFNSVVTYCKNQHQRTNTNLPTPFWFLLVFDIAASNIFFQPPVEVLHTVCPVVPCLQLPESVERIVLHRQAGAPGRRALLSSQESCNTEDLILQHNWRRCATDRRKDQTPLDRPSGLSGGPAGRRQPGRAGRGGGAAEAWRPLSPDYAGCTSIKPAWERRQSRSVDPDQSPTATLYVAEKQNSGIKHYVIKIIYFKTVKTLTFRSNLCLFLILFSIFESRFSAYYHTQHI